MKRSSKMSLYYKITAYLILVFIFIFNEPQDCFSLEITKPNAPALFGTEVNTYTGNLFYQRTDLYIPGRGLSIDLTFSYNSGRTQNNWGFGYGWSFSYGMQYAIDGATITIERGDGDKDEFTWNGSSYIPPPGVYDELKEYLPGQYLLTTKHGKKYYFDDPTHQKLTSIEDRNNNTISLTYSESNLTTITDPGGREVEIEYNPDGTVQRITDPNTSPARMFNYEYDVWGDLIKVTDPLGTETHYSYGRWYNLTGITNGNGHSVAISYNENKAVQFIECPAVYAKKTVEYDTINQITSVKDSIQSGYQETNYHYDLDERVIQIQLPDGNSVFYNWDGQNNITEFIDPNGHAYTYTYDAKGNKLSETDPLGNIETFTYDPVFNLLLSNTNKNGNIYNFSYDGAGNLLNATDPLGNIISFTYDLYGNLITQTDANGNTTTYSYNTNGDLITITDALGYINTYSYDPVGNRISETDANGNITTYSYDDLNRLVNMTDAMGYINTYSYDPVGNRISETDANGNITTYSYDDLNRLVNKTDALGNTITYSYDPVGNRISETDANGNITSYEYDLLNRLIVETNALGNINTYSYNPVGNRISETDANGNTTTYTYDPLNRLIEKTDASGYINTYSYDPVGNRISETDANGNVTSYSYDGLNRLVDKTNALGYINTYSYDPVGNRISETDANGNLTTYTYDPLNRLIEETYPLGYISTYSYDPVGNRISETDANGNVTTYSYDPLNRLVNLTDALGNIITYSYDPVGNKTLEIDANGYLFFYSYDPLNRFIGITDPLGFTQSYTYDAIGNQVSRTNKNGNTANYSYDAINQLVSETDPLGGVKSYTYDPTGKRLSETDANGNTTTYTYTCCRLSSKTNPLGDSEFYDHDPNGNLISKTNMNGNPMQYEYDGLNRIVKMIDALGYETTYTYDPNGNKLTETTPKGNVTSYEYDARNSMTRMTTPLGFETVFNYDGNSNKTEMIKPDGSSEINVYDGLNRVTLTSYSSDNVELEYSYDANGNVTEIINTSLTDIGIITKTYNARNQLISLINDFNGHFTKDIIYGYDGVGNRISMTADGGANSYTFDANNRMFSIENKFSEITSYEYDVAGRRTKKTYANGMYANYTYDMVGNLLSLHYYYPTDDPLAFFDYTYDPNGNRLSASEIVPSQVGTDSTHIEYGFDVLDQLVQENVFNGTLTAYYYDEDRNRMVRDIEGDVTIYYYDADGRLDSTNTINYPPEGPINNTWDPNGNLVEKIQGSDTTRFTYNYPNKLEEVILPAGDTVKYNWTGEGQRMAKTASPMMWALTDCQFCPICCDCHENTVGQYNDAGVEQTHITMGYHHDEVISQRIWGLSYFSITDALGSIRSIIDEWDNIMARYDYDAFGVTIRDDDEFGGLNSYKYTGRILDSEYEQYYYRARNYDPLTGRFTSRDPTWIENVLYPTCGSNSNNLTELPYVYVENNPVNYSDPSGMEKKTFRNMTSLIDHDLIGDHELITTFFFATHWICDSKGLRSFKKPDLEEYRTLDFYYPDPETGYNPFAYKRFAWTHTAQSYQLQRLTKWSFMVVLYAEGTSEGYSAAELGVGLGLTAATIATGGLFGAGITAAEIGAGIIAGGVSFTMGASESIATYPIVFGVACCEDNTYKINRKYMKLPRPKKMDDLYWTPENPWESGAISKPNFSKKYPRQSLKEYKDRKVFYAPLDCQHCKESYERRRKILKMKYRR